MNFKLFFILVSLTGLLNTGLFAQENWEQIDGPYGGIVQSIASAGSTFFAGTQTGGLYKSTDFGSNWTFTGHNLPFNDVQLVYISKERVFVVNREFGLFKSDDWGETWDSAHKDLSSINIRSIVDNEGKLFLAVKNVGVYYSTNNGDNWTLRNFGLQSTAVNYLHNYGGAIYAATDNGIYLTGNQGENWGAFVASGAYQLIERNDNTIFIATTSSVRYTTNNGQDWVNTGTELGQYGTIYSLKSYNNYVMVGRSNGYYAATFSGSVIAKIHQTLPSQRVYAIHRDMNFFYAGTSKGVFYSQNYGSSWQNSYTGINNERITSLFVTDDKYYAGSYENGLEYSDDRGKTWEDMNLGNVYVKKILITGKDIYAIAGNQIRYSNSDGVTWEERKTSSDKVKTINSVYEHKGTIYMCTNVGVYYSTNKGLLWFDLSIEVQTTNIRDMYIDKNEYYYLITADKLLLSRDKGKTWIESFEGMNSYNLTCIHGYDDYVLVGSYPQTAFEADFYISSDQGRNWKASGLDLTDQYVADIDNHNDILFLSLRGISGADSRGVYFSSNFGKSWVEYNKSIRHKDVPAIFVKGDEILAGTFGSGIYRSGIPVPIFPPDILFPSDKQTNIPLKPLLDFTDAASAEKYIIQMSTSRLFEEKKIIINDTIDISEYQITKDLLTYETTYYWRVCQLQGEKFSEWTDIHEFTTQKDIITKAVLTSPANSSTDLWVETELSWEALAEAQEYNIQIADVNDFSNIIFELAVSGTNYTVPKGKLDFDKEYFWRVNAKIYDIDREWSEPFSFKTMKFALVKPSLNNVVDNSDGVIISVKLSWEAVQNSDAYNIQVSKDNQFTDVVFDESTDETEVVLTKTNLDFNTDYFWRVKAKYLTNEADWSDVSTFKTMQEVSVNELNSTDEIKIYPNPSSGMLNILLENENVNSFTVRVFNSIGYELFQKEYINTGKELSINLPHDISNGVYIIEINNTFRKLTIIK